MADDASPVDERLMRLAVALGDRNAGLTWPNPSVGAVLVAPDGRILSVGVTQPGGRPHAEPVALAQAGASTRGATLYVSLEPCSHHGRTPPCAEAIVAHGVARVVTALVDPNPLVAGLGHRMLAEAGIAVSAGILAEEAARSHRGHIARITRGRPWVTLKLARTRDGYAGSPGRRVLITGDAANRRTHLMRAQSDAVMVGIATVLADDPRLDVRLPGLAARSPLRIVVDTNLRLPLTSHVVMSAEALPTWMLCGADASPDAERRLADRHVTVIRAPLDPQGRVDLTAAMRELGGRGLTAVLCEGGPALAESLAEQDLVDDMVLLTGPDDLPGRDGLPAIGPALRETVRRFRSRERAIVGRDVVETFLRG